MKALRDSLQADSIASIDEEIEQILLSQTQIHTSTRTGRTLLDHSAPWQARPHLPWIKSFRQREVQTEAGN